MRRFYLSTLLFITILLSSSWLRAQTTSFNYVGGIQSYTVPTGVTVLVVNAAGGKGGDNNNWPSGTYPSQGGNGGRVVCSLAVTPGQVLSINVGGQGTAGISGGSYAAGGYNGGGTGGSGYGAYAGGGGGGATDISITGTKVVIAGGGGGAGLDYPGGNRELGGAGGGLIGGAGYFAGSNTNLAGGQGGTQTAGGVNGSGAGTPGSLGTGGNAYLSGASGGGGGGYYGGGGGGSSWAAGGGGSSYTDAVLATDVTHTQAANAGDGYVTITAPCAAPSITSTVSSVCPGSTINLTASPTGGTWSSSDATVSVNGTTGDVTGVSTGTAIVTYTAPSACTNTTTITVLQAPGTISGAGSVCAGSITTLSNPMSGGSWSSTNTGVATIGSDSGDVTGVATGTTTVSYVLTNGCLTSTSFVVNPIPGAISGTTAACEGLTSTLSNSVTGGTWSSDNTGVATVGSTGGDVLGVSAGTVNITYTLPGGCFTSVPFTVNAVPAITGASAVCVASTTTLSASEGGGTWMSTDVTVATASSAGDIGGVMAGTSSIIYTTPEGCTNAITMTVNPLPNAITGTATVCPELTTTLSDATAGGTWSSSDAAVAVAGTAGDITGMNAGTATIYYILPTSCATSVTFTTKALPAAMNVSGGGNYCANGSGVIVGIDNSETGVNYDLYINGGLSATIAGTGGAFDFGLQTIVGIYTVGATNTTTGCIANMSGFADVDTLPLPAVYNVTGGGAYCIGGAGVHVGLSNSNAGFNYQVYLDGTAVSTAFAGSGGPLDFGLRTAAGVYTVVSTNTATGCVSNMADSATVAINALPLAYAVTGGGNYCAGGTDVHVMLSGSESGVNYQLYYGAIAVGSALSSTGTTLDFGLSTSAGSYSVVATNATTGCVNNMTGTATIAINALPTMYTIIGGGSYCEGGTGTHVELSGSDTGISYQLHLGTGSIGGAVTGSGTTLDFGAVTGAGSYTATATNTHTGCTSNMISSAAVSINPAPTAYTVGGGGSYCAGGTGRTVTLSGSNTGISYQLYDTVTVGTPVSGTGSALSFGAYTAPGTYTVIATNSTTGCTANMTGGATIIITPLVTPTIGATNSGADTICSGTRILYTAHATDGGSSPVIYWTVNGTTMATADTFSYVPVSADSIVVTLISNAACATVDTVRDTTVMTIIANQTPTVSISVNPGDTVCNGTPVTFTAANAFGGSAPAYTWVKNGASVSSGNSYSFTPANGDIVYATLNSNYRCLTSTATVFSNNTTMTVDNIVVPSVTVTGASTIAPGHTDTLTASVTNGGIAPSYQWYINSSAVTGANSATLIHSFANNDSVSVKVTRNDACHLSTFNGLKIQVINLGIQSLGAGTFSVLPNPSKGTFAVRGAVNGSDAEATITVVNMLGQTVYSGKAAVRNSQLDEQVTLGNIANGTYLLHISTSTGNSVFHLVVAQ